MTSSAMVALARALDSCKLAECAEDRKSVDFLYFQATF